MAYTNTPWSNIIPAGGDPLNTADDQIRQLRLDIQERMDDVVVDWTVDPVVPKIQPADLAVVYSGVDFTIATGGATVDFVQETLDTGSFHDNAVNPSRLTITTAAYYRLSAVLRMTNGANSPFNGAIELRKNGARIAGSTIRFDAASVILSQSISYIDLAAAADFYELFYAQSSGNSWTMLGDSDESWFMIEKMARS